MDRFLLYKIGLVFFIMIIPSLHAAPFESLSKEESSRFLNNIENTNSIDTLQYTMSFSKPEINKKDEEFAQISLKEANANRYAPGVYKLPYYSKTLIFPFGTKILDVECVHSQPASIMINQKIEVATVQKNDPAYVLQQNQLEKNQWFQWKTGGGIHNGEHVLFVVITFHPLQYQKNEQALLFSNHVEITIQYETGSYQPFENEDTYDLLILSPDGFQNALEELIVHKNNVGIKTKLVTITDIYQDIYFSVDGRDNAEEIKYFIYHAWTEWGIDAVLLVGNINKIPIRKTWMGTGEYERTPLTDLYYADLCFGDGSFCSWDSNGNGFYGEVWHGTQDDLVDLYPDVHIGRLACNNIIEVQTVVEKIIQYETTAFGKDWAQTCILIGGDTHPSHNSYPEGEILIDEIAKVTPSLTHVMLKTSEETFSPESVNTALNRGAGFMCYAGHGFELGLSTHPPNSEEWIDYSMYHLLDLQNKEMLPIAFFNACLTARLDYNIVNLLSDILYFSSPLPKLEKRDDITFPLLFPCFAWRMVAQPNGGAVATIGATRVSYGMIDESGNIPGGCSYFTLKFFKAYAKSEYLSEMFVSAENDYLHNASWMDPFIVEEMILLGDPTLKVGGYE